MTTELAGIANILVNSCPISTGPETCEFTEKTWAYILWLHWEWLKRNPEVECSCR